MKLLFNIIICICFILLFLQILKIRAFAKDLVRAIQNRQHLLPNRLSRFLQLVGLDTLCTELNELIDRHNEYAKAQVGRLNQLEATLGSIQEAVIIFSANREIEYANKSAKKLFNQGGSLRGLRLESVLRSSSLIEFLSTYPDDPSDQVQQVNFEIDGALFWFEASCAEVREVTEVNDVSTLLVLHNITKLKRLEEVRRDFVANVSHELRTPITIIKGYTETLVEENKTLTAEKRAHFLEKIDKNIQRLHLLVEDLMELSRLESKPDHINPSIESLKYLLDETLENYSSRLDPQKQKMLLTFDENIEEFPFDRFRIQQVFENLIENAFRYAPEFTLIKLEVEYRYATNDVECAVIDDGQGIPEKDLPHIFERFFRVDKGRSYESGGTGLGLSIMKHIVQQHGGTVRAESQPGKGTAIYFTLPYLPYAQTTTSIRNEEILAVKPNDKSKTHD